MEKNLHSKILKFLNKELFDQELNSAVLKKIDNQRYKISKYQVATSTATVEDSTGALYQFLNVSSAVVYCCLMSTNRLNEAYTVRFLNDELGRLAQKIKITKKRALSTSNPANKDIMVAKLLEYENQYTAKVDQLKKNIAQAKYIIKPGHANGS